MPVDFTALARAGARIRLAEVLAELAEIERAFPGLRVARQRDVTRRPRRAMTAEEREAVAVRMKAYWAACRQAGDQSSMGAAESVAR